MSRVRNRDTTPERTVRSLLHRLGYRFRLHRRRLPGHPDIVLPRHRKVIFVHGCFWHGHEGCRRGRRPAANADFWERKLATNKERDALAVKKLGSQGWNSLVVWECQTRNAEELAERLLGFLQAG